MKFTQGTFKSHLSFNLNNFQLISGQNGVFDLKKNFALIELIERLHANEASEIFSPAFIDRERELAVPCDENESHLVRSTFFY